MPKLLSYTLLAAAGPADSSHSQDNLHSTRWGPEQLEHTHNFRILVVHTRSIHHHIGWHLAEPANETHQISIRVHEHMRISQEKFKVSANVKTCLFEGLRPHDNRIFCPLN